MDRLVPVISDLQEIIRRSAVNLEISLPMIAVVGSQSTGKSSLLEAIIGKEFLPKGKGIVTRRPAEIQLCKTNAEKDYAELIDKKETFENMEDLRKAIDAETERVCGSNKNINPQPIRIRFYSKKVLNLLLVDLPGIIKNPVGDQPKDIEDQITKLIKQYIRNPNCIIVAVSKATEDSANSESLKLAREFDKQGSRTIGVITHIDMADPSINVLSDYGILTDDIALEHIGVCLRPSKSDRTIEDQFEEEKEFFRKSQVYKHISEKMGVKALIRLMNMVLIKHIRQELPVIREQIVFLLQKKRSKIADYGCYEVSSDKKGQGTLILSLISRYVKHLSELIEGRHTESRQEVIGGARIEYIFSQIFIKSIKKMNPFQYLTDQDIRTAIRNANGLRKSLFLPEAAFENLLRTQIIRLRGPSLECAQLIHEELRRVIYNVRLPEIDRYECLSNRIFEVMENLLDKSLAKTEEMIKNLIEIEIGYINTNHPDFIDVITLISQQPEHSEHSKNALNLSIDSEFEPQQQSSREMEYIKQDTSLFKFQIKKNEKDYEHPEIMEAKINQIASSQLRPKESTIARNKKQQLELDSFETSLWDRGQTPPYKLPYVPTSIQVNDKPKMREQTETEMIKKLISSYFNVVKKNINDSVPKSIVTFLVNHCKSSCEKILVSQIYVESDYEKLLKEKEYITSERDRLYKDVECLSECLDSVNKIESELIL